MSDEKFKRLTIIYALILAFSYVFFSLISSFQSKAIKTFAMPFYDLQPQKIVVRSEFYTSYTTSSPERKNNIKLATSALDNYFLDVGAEFSFNMTVGERTEKRGYQSARIIFNGKFIDGVGGGVCQVSSTLYNAALLAGLRIIEYHPHTLPVSYVAPSFDAMVNSGSADLKFVNDTHNPVIIKAVTNDATVKITILGEPMFEKITRQSVVVGEIKAQKEEEIFDNAGEYPDLYQGEKKVLSYSKNGLMSEGYLVKSKNGKPTSVIKIRTDKYSAMRGLIVNGTAIRQERMGDNELENQLSFKQNIATGD